MNTFADDIDRSSTLSELERIGARASRKGIQRTELEDRIRGEGKLLNSLIDQGRSTPEFRDSPFYQEQTSSLRDSIRGIRSRMNSLDSTARSRAESEASSYISRQFSSTAINAQTSMMQREAATQNRAFSMSGLSYDELQNRREDVLADIRVRERNAQNEIKGMFSGRGEVNPERSAALGVMMSGTQEHFRSLATINAAQVLQKASGNDPNSRIRNLAEMGGIANGILSAQSIAQEVNNGGVSISQGGKMGTVANEDISREIVNQARVLSQALKELADGAGKTDEELQKLRSTADESASNLDKLQRAEGAGGGGRGTIMSYLSAAGGAFNAIGSGAQQVLVNQRMQETANIGGFAGLANQQYDLYKKARGGDIASQLALGQFGSADDFGMEMKRGTNIAQSAYLAAGGLQTAAGGMQVAEGLKNAPTLGYLNSGVGNNLAQGAQNVAQGLSTVGVTAADMAKGTSAQAARLAGIQAQMQARMAINAVGASQAQGLRDMFTGLDVVGQDMGRGSSAFIANAAGAGNLDRMANARMSPEQFIQASQSGAQNMGSTFGVNSVFASRNMERSGFGSMSSNMSRMATLAGAGANNPTEGMEAVLAAAMSKGLDSSKAISMMVDNTAAMVSSSAGAAVGIDTTAATSSMLATSMNPAMANKEFALQQAMSAAQVTHQNTTDRSVSFTGMSNTAGIQSALARQGINIGGTEALIAQGIDIATLKSMQGDPKKAAEFFKNQGVNIREGNANTFVDTMLDQKFTQLLKPGGLAVNADIGKLAKNLKSGQTSEADDLVLGQIAALQGRKGGAAELRREAQGIGAQNVAVGAARDVMEGKGQDDLKKQMDNLRTSGFKQLTEAAASASVQLGGFEKALKTFQDLTMKFEKDGMGNEKEFSGAAGQFAKDFSASIGRFDTATTQYEKASRAIIDAVGLKSNRMPLVPNFVNETLDKSKAISK